MHLLTWILQAADIRRLPTFFLTQTTGDAYRLVITLLIIPRFASLQDAYSRILPLEEERVLLCRSEVEYHRLVEL